MSSKRISGPRMVMRSKSPALVKQEIWSHLCCHYAIRTLMVEAAQHARRWRIGVFS
jgi:hypothetical protein